MRHIARLIAVLALLALPLIAFAQEAASLPSDLPGVIGWFAQTHAAGEWSLLIGGALTLLVRLLTLLRPLADKLPPEATKWLAMGLAMLGSAATGLLSHVPWYKVVADGVLVGVAAIGGWELVLKPVLDKLGLSKSPTGPVKT
jgi:hypothetical protein